MQKGVASKPRPPHLISQLSCDCKEKSGGKMRNCSLLAVMLFSLVWGTEWPIVPEVFKERPQVDSYCNGALYPFCPTGFSDSHIPKFDDDDTIELYVLKAPVWEFKFGKLLADFDIIHDAIGIKSIKTGLNYTTEWYELFQLFNCTFPHLVKGRPAPVWCNQGAACLYPGIDDKHWSQNGTLIKVANMTGSQFNKLSEYIKNYNQTLPFYETWRVRNTTGAHYQQWFSPCDCATYVQKVFCQATKLGAKFVDTYTPNYTFITLISGEPLKLGNATEVFESGKNQDLAEDIMKFYSDVQAHQSPLHLVKSILNLLDYVVLNEKFYLYYNGDYWQLPMRYPYVKLTYEPITYDYCYN